MNHCLRPWEFCLAVSEHRFSSSEIDTSGDSTKYWANCCVSWTFLARYSASSGDPFFFGPRFLGSFCCWATLMGFSLASITVLSMLRWPITRPVVSCYKPIILSCSICGSTICSTCLESLDIVASLGTESISTIIRKFSFSWSSCKVCLTVNCWYSNLRTMIERTDSKG